MDGNHSKAAFGNCSLKFKMLHLKDDVLKSYFMDVQQYEDQQQIIKRKMTKAFMLMAECRKSTPDIIAPGTGSTRVSISTEANFELIVNPDLNKVRKFVPPNEKLMQKEFVDLLQLLVELANITQKLKEVEIMSKEE